MSSVQRLERLNPQQTMWCLMQTSINIRKMNWLRSVILDRIHLMRLNGEKVMAIEHQMIFFNWKKILMRILW